MTYGHPSLYLKMYTFIYYLFLNFTFVRCLDFSKIVSMIFIDWLQTFAFFRKLFEKLKKKNIWKRIEFLSNLQFIKCTKLMESIL